ncbi:MAG TPA: hypothetical protein VF746_24500 [Longimicrobium sp.]|jgi:hypothetical protein
MMPISRRSARRPRPEAARLSALLYGFAHVLDFGGAFARDRGRFSGGFAADARAIRGDWERALGGAAGLADEQAS